MRSWVAVAVAAAVLASGCGTAGVAQGSIDRQNGQTTMLAPAAVTAQLAVYPAGSACASVKTAMPIAQVPAACAAQWRRFGVRVVPGQDLISRLPALAPVSVGPGVDTRDAARYAAALWRMDAFKAFALATRQIGIVDGLGPDSFFRRASQEVQAIVAGDQITQPTCHAFPTALRVVRLTPDFESFARRSGVALGVKVTFTGPCTGTATDAHGAVHQLYTFDGRQSVVYVGDIGSDAPLGNVLELTALGDCRQPVAKRTCAS